jgi:membrane protein required for colicin V production
MNWVDLVVLVIVVLSGLAGFVRGLVREVLGVGAWVAALLVASPWGLFPTAAPIARQHVSDPLLADGVAFLAVFVPALIVLWVIARVLSGYVQRSAVSGLDRTLGLVFGLVRGALVVVAAYIIAGLAIPVEQWPAPVLQARSLPLVGEGAAWTAAQVPARYRPAVQPPPDGDPVRAADLLHATPAGRALARPARP